MHVECDSNMGEYDSYSGEYDSFTGTHGTSEDVTTQPKSIAEPSSQMHDWTVLCFCSFAACAILGGYCIYQSSCPDPAKGQAAPLWPYLSVLSAFVIAGTSGLLGFLAWQYFDDNNATLLCWCSYAPPHVLGLVHVFMGLFYSLNYKGQDYTLPSLWACYITICACIDAVVCLFMRTRLVKVQASRIQSRNDHERLLQVVSYLRQAI